MGREVPRRPSVHRQLGHAPLHAAAPLERPRSGYRPAVLRGGERIRLGQGRPDHPFFRAPRRAGRLVRGGGYGEGLLASLAQTRAELARGDLRALYLGWLLCAQNGEFEDEEEEPRVPPGLGALSAPLQSLIEFLAIDPHLVHVAAEASRPLAETVPPQAELTRWIESLPDAAKNRYLLRLLEEPQMQLAGELLRSFRSREGSTAGRPETAAPRTVGMLLEAAKAYAEEQRRLEAVRAERERQRREQEEAKARRRTWTPWRGKRKASGGEWTS